METDSYEPAFQPPQEVQYSMSSAPVPFSEDKESYVEMAMFPYSAPPQPTVFSAETFGLVMPDGSWLPYSDNQSYQTVGVY